MVPSTDLARSSASRLLDLTVALAQAGAGGDELGKLGLTGRTLTPDLAKQSNLVGERGALITKVKAASVASLAGLQAGDLIAEVNKHSVTSIDDMRRVLAQAGDTKGVLLLVKRGDASLFVFLGTQ